VTRRLARAGACVLAAFHAGLLARRLGEPEAFDATAAWRWAGALAVLGALAALRRARLNAFSGRRAFALGLAVLLLHAPALDQPGARAADLLAALPGALVPVLGLLVLASPWASGSPRLALLRLKVAPAHGCRRRRLPALSLLSPRPPPSASLA